VQRLELDGRERLLGLGRFVSSGLVFHTVLNEASAGDGSDVHVVAWSLLGWWILARRRRNRQVLMGGRYAG